MKTLTQHDDMKYAVFKREDLYTVLRKLGVSLEEAESIDLANAEIVDAVVIRRQDVFASPCLLTYAAMISMVAKNHPDVAVGQELLVIADYFHGQGVLAGDEGYKLPTL